MLRGFCRFVPFLFLSLLRAPMRNSPERVRDTIWTFPEKSGKPLGLEPPRFSFSQLSFHCILTLRKVIGDKKPINTNNFSGLSREWVGVKFCLCVAFFLGEKGKHIKTIRRQSQENVWTVPGKSQNNPGAIP